MLVELNSNKRSSTAKDEQNKQLINIKRKRMFVLTVLSPHQQKIH